MIDAQLVEYRSMKIMDVHRVFKKIVAKFVRLAINHTRLDTASGHPYAEAARVMVPAVIVLEQFALTIIGAAEFSAPDDQRFVQKTALL